MKIKLKTTMAGPNGTYQPNRVLESGADISKEECRDLLRGGYAIPVKAEAERAVNPAPETRQQQPAQGDDKVSQAAKTASKGKGGGGKKPSKK